MTMVTMRVAVDSGIGKIAAELEPRAARVVRKAALDLEGHAKGRAPVDTGFLRSSIQAVQVGPLHWQVRVGADYGVYVEYGTRYMAAQPYLNPAADLIRGPFVQAMKSVVAG